MTGSRQSSAAVDSPADQLVLVADAVQAFRVSEEQDVTRALQRGHALEQRALRVLVEIDDDVAAEDRVERTAHRPLVHEVELLEGDQAAQLVAHAEFAGVLAAALARRSARRARALTDLQALGVVDAGRAGREHRGIEVGRQQLDVAAGRACRCASRSTMAMEYGSSPVDAAQHQMRSAARRPCLARRSSAARRSPGIRSDAARGRTR